MAGRAQGYSDYYKNNSESSADVEGIKQAPNTSGAQSPTKSTPGKPDSVAERRKAAIRRRMMKMKSASSAKG